MGTTKTQMQTGSIRWQLCATIEGYPYVLTDGDTGAAATAYSGDDWSAALGGLTVEIRTTSEIQPWRSMSGHATCTLRVANETFGVDTHKMATGAETVLTATLDRDDTTVSVKSTTGFTVPGTFYIGNECFNATASTATTFTVDRGYYSPFKTSDGSRFAEDHRAGNVDYAINLEPIVSQYRRVWTGAWIAVRAHRVVGGVLDTPDEAQLIFAGTVDQIMDDVSQTVVSCVGIQERVKSAVLLKEQYKARLATGLYLALADVRTLSASDFDGSTNTANSLTLAVGYYTPEELHSAINEWLAGETAAGRLAAEYLFTFVPGESDTRSHLKVKFTGVLSSQNVVYNIDMPRTIAAYLGWVDPVPDATITTDLHDSKFGGTTFDHEGGFSVKAILGDRFQIDLAIGTAIDQGDYLPPEFGIIHLVGSPNCVLELDDGLRFVGNVSSTEIVVYKGSVAPGDWSRFQRDYHPDDPPWVAEVKQVVVYSGKAKTLIPALLYSTGTTGYNDATYDVAGSGGGLGIPGELLSSLVSTIAYSPLADTVITLPIDKPTKFEKVIDSTLVLLGLFLIWKDQSLRFAEFTMPTSGASVLALGEGNKAERDASTRQVSPTVINTEWVKPVVKLAFLTVDGRERNEWCVDRTTVDDQNGDIAPATIDGKNIRYDDVDWVLADFKSRLGFYTRPLHRITRSISLAQFEGYSAGDVVTVTDNLARDPVSGIRGTTMRAGLIIRHSWTLTWGTKDSGMAGEVEVVMPVVSKAANWSPCAEVDDTAANGGYDSATKTITTYQHEHSETSETGDAQRFTVGDGILIVQADPDDPSSVLSWVRGVVSSTGTTIVHDGVALAGWDSSLRYRVISDTYTGTSDNQDDDAYQADDADALVEDSAVPFKYELAPNTLFTAEDGTELAEFVANLAHGDGKPVDTGHQRARMRTVNQMIDRKTAHQSPALRNSAATQTAYAGYSVRFVELYYAGQQYPGFASRVLSVAPWMRSGDGSSVSVRVTLCRALPTGSSADGATLPAINSQVTFTTSSTTWAVATAQDLDLDVIGTAGWGYLIIELGQHAECRGLARIVEGARS